MAEFTGVFYKAIYKKDNFVIALYMDIDTKKSVKCEGQFLPQDKFVTSFEGDVKQSKYGEIFSVSYMKRLIKSDHRNVITLLQQSGCDFITADSIFGVFGEATLKTVERLPEKIVGIRGLTQKTALAISDEVLLQRSARGLLCKLFPLGFSTTQICQIYRLAGNKAIDWAVNDPYEFADMPGGTFHLADELAAKDGYDAQSPQVIWGKILFEMKRNEACGNTGISLEGLIKKVSRYGYTREQIRGVIDRKFIDKRLSYSKKEKLFLRKSASGAEYAIAQRAYELCQNPGDVITGIPEKIIEWEKCHGMTLAVQQKQAVEAALSNGFSVITGGPGRGKTTIMQVITDIRRKYGKRKDSRLMAPTGRAAKKLAESTGLPSTTIHRTLCIDDAESFRPQPDTITEATVIVDESSMLDIWLARDLMKSVSDDSQLTFVGDIDQLPSVGAGAVLRDLIESGLVPVVRLTDVFRQKGDSNIIPNAEKIRVGDDSLIFDGKTFMAYQADEDMEACKDILTIYRNKVAQYGKEQVILLSPLHRGTTKCCVDSLNGYAQYYVNPVGKSVTCGNRIFREGDLVLQTRNWNGLANGDVGTVVGVDEQNCTLDIQFGDNVQTYEKEDLNMLELGYSMSIHKSQGSEYACVIMCILPSQMRMLNRNLIYTGITRAKKECILVGDQSAVSYAIGHEETYSRQTTLKDKLSYYFTHGVDVKND